MASRIHVHGLSVRLDGDAALVCVGRKQVWDRADLSLLRDTFHRLVHDGSRSISVNLSGLQCIPSGFFGSLMDLSDRGIAVFLVAPHERVRQMLWFREFFHRDCVDCYSLRQEQCTFRFGDRDLESVMHCV